MRLPDWLRRLLGAPSPTPDNSLVARTPREVPPRPADWALTVDDLMAEMKAGTRRSASAVELAWARDYEHSRLPPGLRYPRAGDVYAARADMEVEFMTAWAAPCTGGGKGWLHAGDRLVVRSDPGEAQPLGAYAEAEDYARLEERMVPAADRRAAKYGGFYFWLRTTELNTRFTLVASRPEA